MAPRQPLPGSGRAPDDDRLRPDEAPWLLAAILLPVAVNPWSQGIFVTPKLLVLWTSAALAVGWALSNRFARRTSFLQEGWSLPALAFLVATLVATLLAADRRQALWGSFERGMGCITLLATIGLSLSLYGYLRSSPSAAAPVARRLLGAMALGSVPVVAVAAAQALGWRFGDLATDSRSPLFATLGRSNFVAAYLALVLPLSLTLFAAARRPVARSALAGLVCAQALVIAVTGNRGGLLAAFLALTVFAVGHQRHRLSLLWQRPLLRAAILGSLATAAAVGLWLAQAGGSGAARLAIWQATLRLVVRRPFFGYGPDNLGLVFSRVYPPELVYYQGRGVDVDRAHNLPLDLMASVGVLGLAAWLSVLGIALLAALRKLRASDGDERTSLFALGILAALLGHLGGLQIGFETLTTTTLSWLLLATLAGLGERPAATPSEDRAVVPAALRIGGVLLSTTVALVVASRLVAADTLVGLAAEKAAAGDWSRGLEAAEEGIALRPSEPALRLELADLYRRWGRSVPEHAGRSLEAAAAHARRATELAPLQYRSWALLGEILAERVALGEGALLGDAMAAYGRALELAPNHAVLFAAAGRTLLLGGELDRAAATFARAVDLDSTDVGSWIHLGRVEGLRGRPREAAEAFRQVLSRRPDALPALQGLAAAALELGDLQLAATLVDRARRLAPESAEIAALERRLEELERPEGGADSESPSVEPQPPAHTGPEPESPP